MIKNAGVPLMPMSSAIFESASTNFWCVRSSSALRNFAMSRLSSSAYFSSAARSRPPGVFWFSKSLSWNFQKPSMPFCFIASTAASLARGADLWKGSGLWCQTIFTLSP